MDNIYLLTLLLTISNFPFFYFKDDDKRGIFLHQKASIYFSNKDSSLTNEGVKDATEMGMKKIH